MIDRIANVPLRPRIIRIGNEILTPLLCLPFGLTHVVEHPKCGGSWIRNMLADYLGVDRYLGQRLIRPNDVVQVHRLFRRSYLRPVVVVRDPRDMFVSFYHHERHELEQGMQIAIRHHYAHQPDRNLEDDFAAYLEAKLSHRTHPRFSYTEFVQAWAGRPSACLVRYEDFLEDAEAELIRVARFLKRPLDLERVRAVIERNRFESETRERYGRARKPGEADPEGFRFQRKGIAGDWRNHFNREACLLIQRFEGWTLRRLGYEADRGWIERYLAGRA